jgi:hypothetical protein
MVARRDAVEDMRESEGVRTDILEMRNCNSYPTTSLIIYTTLSITKLSKTNYKVAGDCASFNPKPFKKIKQSSIGSLQKYKTFNN